MAARNEYETGFLNTSIHDFLGEIEVPPASMAYILITCLDSNPDVLGVFRWFGEKDKGPSRPRFTPVGRGVLVPAKGLIAADRRERIFFGFDEIWCFPSNKIGPKPEELTITRPGSIDPLEFKRHLPWMQENQCSLGLGDGEGMNYCLKVQGVARFVVRAFNETMSPASA